VPRRPAKPAPQAPAPPPAPDTVRVRFAREHTHAGVQYHAGDELDVSPAVADLLRYYSAIE